MNEIGAGATSSETLEVLRKVLPDGRLQRIPRNPAHRDVVLALLCLDLQRRYPYAEQELNVVLGEGLARLDARVDHVTCRRYMVDLGFLKRDRAGTRYFLNYPKVEATLSEGAIAASASLIDSAIVWNRRRRRRSNGISRR